MIKKYRKLPVVVEAMQYDEKTLIGDIIDFIGSSFCGTNGDKILINTLEGVLSVSVGDYIIKGIKGEFYPCKPDIFNNTYEVLG